jgi:hypothetical protein
MVDFLFEFVAKDKRIIKDIGNYFFYSNLPISKNTEDAMICHVNKEYLERNGFKFAPEFLGRKFSAELEPYVSQVGFHGKYFEHHKKMVIT